MTTAKTPLPKVSTMASSACSSVCQAVMTLAGVACQLCYSFVCASRGVTHLCSDAGMLCATGRPSFSMNCA